MKLIKPYYLCLLPIIGNFRSRHPAKLALTHDSPACIVNSPLAALTAAALVLPGLLPNFAEAAQEDGVDFQYSHYQEGKRDIYGMVNHDHSFLTPTIASKLPQNLKPIEVDSVHGSGRVSLTECVKFAFNYTQDTWSGATPIGTAPVVSGVNRPTGSVDKSFAITQITGASPIIGQGAGMSSIFTNNNQSRIYQYVYDSVTKKYVPGDMNNQLVHVLSYASPETRKQGDFKLGYEWDEAVLDAGGGISIENDYESRFGNLGGRLDFNQKQTTVNWGLSYTNSDTFATLDPDALPFIDTSLYDNSSLKLVRINQFNEEVYREVPKQSQAPAGEVDSTYPLLGPTGRTRSSSILHGNRQDWGSQLGLTQVLNKNALLALDLGYTRSTGYQANPYKVVFVYSLPAKMDADTLYAVKGTAFLETRPAERNQLNWHIGYDHYLEPIEAALHFDYHFAHDDWGINAHTFEADWVQPLGADWAVTPRIRYYSQSKAHFYTTGVFTGEKFDSVNFPKYYSSDQRLSGFGALSGGVTVSKQFAKGISLETGFEYYTHQGGLKLGGGGEQAFADYDFWVANAALKINLDALNAGGGGHDGHTRHPHHSNAPAGIMFDHVLPKSGFMVAYRYLRSEQAGALLFGDQPVGIDRARAKGCGHKPCAVTPDFMAMNMHMLDLMAAPTDRLTLMLMPQWMDMDMTMTANPNARLTGGHSGHSSAHGHQTGGLGDLGLYALFKVLDQSNHSLILSLGGTAPTGAVDITLRKTGTTPVDNQPLHYGMQLGSGTWDFKPSLTYAGEAGPFVWGAQVTGTLRLEGRNESGFAFGDIIQGSMWGGYHWTNWLASTVRGVYTGQDRIHGAYPPSTAVDPTTGRRFVPQHVGPFDFPDNYGGQFVDLGLGLNVTIPDGAWVGNSLKFEWLQPVHTDYNGYQLDRDGGLSFTWSAGF
ncbi:MAG: DUF3570 domain-containing protein [Methylovulum sp.]|nr:DUF3570 domain-containing protein [Methylovulum sp.]